MKPRIKKSKNNKSKNKTRKINKTRKSKRIILKGGNNPFSDVFGLWGTMTYNLSNAFSVFTITPPSGGTNPTDKVINPSPGNQFN
jgi:hypothetical protein